MNVREIAKYSVKPELYTPGTATMWTDKYISAQLLKIHLDKETDLASRKKNSIEKTVTWIAKSIAKETATILDLGCGPGLYATLLAQKGHMVTGVDFSENSIKYAQKKARKKQLNIHYLNKNYLQLQLEKKQFDVVILIYTDYGVLTPAERKKLLQNIRKWLKPGGIFIFDVNSDKGLEKKVTAKSWETTEKGFWSEHPYLALSESFLYRKEKVILYQHIVSNEANQLSVYRFYTQFFSMDDLQNELTAAGFSGNHFYSNVLPPGDLWNGEHVLFCIARNSK